MKKESITESSYSGYLGNDAYDYDRDKASKLYEGLIFQGYPRVRLVRSSDTFSHGLWLEATMNTYSQLGPFDMVVKEYHKPDFYVNYTKGPWGEDKDLPRNPSGI